MSAELSPDHPLHGSCLCGGVRFEVTAPSTSNTSEASMVDDDRPPICPRCGVTMVPAALSAEPEREAEWVCLECEELDEES